MAYAVEIIGDDRKKDLLKGCSAVNYHTHKADING